MTSNKARIAHLIVVLDSYAPETAEAKKMIDEIVNRNDRHVTDAERILELVGTLYDGVAYGNWPWVVAKLNRRVK